MYLALQIKAVGKDWENLCRINCREGMPQETIINSVSYLAQQQTEWAYARYFPDASYRIVRLNQDGTVASNGRAALVLPN